MYKLSYLFAILLVLFLIFEGYQIYTTGILHVKYATFYLTETQKLIVSLFLILSSIFILYQLITYNKDKEK